MKTRAISFKTNIHLLHLQIYSWGFNETLLPCTLNMQNPGLCSAPSLILSTVPERGGGSLSKRELVPLLLMQRACAKRPCTCSWLWAERQVWEVHHGGNHLPTKQAASHPGEYQVAVLSCGLSLSPNVTVFPALCKEAEAALWLV